VHLRSKGARFKQMPVRGAKVRLACGVRSAGVRGCSGGRGSEVRGPKISRARTPAGRLDNGGSEREAKLKSTLRHKLINRLCPPQGSWLPSASTPAANSASSQADRKKLRCSRRQTRGQTSSRPAFRRRPHPQGMTNKQKTHKYSSLCLTAALTHLQPNPAGGRPRHTPRPPGGGGRRSTRPGWKVGRRPLRQSPPLLLSPGQGPDFNAGALGFL